MLRLMVFLSLLVGFVIILTLSTYKNAPITTEKFDFKKATEAHYAHVNLINKTTSPDEESSKPEAVVVEAGPKVELNTPALVSGEKVYSKCVACHGKSGEGIVSQKAAHIGGQYDWYLEKQLTDMKSGTRVNEAMNPTLKGLSDQDIKDVAGYITKLPWKKLN